MGKREQAGFITPTGVWPRNKDGQGRRGHRAVPMSLCVARELLRGWFLHPSAHSSPPDPLNEQGSSHQPPSLPVPPLRPHPLLCSPLCPQPLQCHPCVPIPSWAHPCVPMPSRYRTSAGAPSPPWWSHCRSPGLGLAGRPPSTFGSPLAVKPRLLSRWPAPAPAGVPRQAPPERCPSRTPALAPALRIKPQPKRRSQCQHMMSTCGGPLVARGPTLSSKALMGWAALQMKAPVPRLACTCWPPSCNFLEGKGSRC